jgi:phosphatidylglycerophosphatase A
LKLNLIEKIIGSGIFTGYIPFASGTFGSLAAVIIYLIPGFENPTIMLIAISLFLVVGAQIGSKFEKIYGKDPKECTIDEFIGTWISLLFLPKNAVYLAGAFLIWRFFDIIKPFPANILEKIKGGWGIMLDDVAAGFYSFIVIQIIIYFIY